MHSTLLIISGTLKAKGSPKISFTLANVITKSETNKSAMANEAKNRFPMRRKLRSV